MIAALAALALAVVGTVTTTTMQAPPAYAATDTDPSFRLIPADLEFVPEDQGLRLVSPVAEPPKALRLGSVRLEDNFRVKRVDLRNLFGTE